MIRQRIMVVCVLTFMLITQGAVPLVGADDEPRFAVSTLSVADELLDIVDEDLNADGLKDIFIVHRKGLRPEQTRWVSVFWQSREGSFATGADQSWEIDTAATILDTGDVTGDGRKEICYLTGNEVRYYPLGAQAYSDESRSLFAADPLTVYPARNTIPLINFVRDWNDDGRDEVGIFQFSGLAIHTPDSSGQFSSDDKITVELKTGMDRVGNDESDDDLYTAGLSAQFTFPNIQLVDYDNDGLKDLIAITDERVMVYRQTAEGKFIGQPNADNLFDVLTQQEKLERLANVETVVHDLNADGYADAIVTKQTSKGLSNFRGVINVFWGTDSGYAAVPDQAIISEGTASASVFIRDVNGDDRRDLILPSVKISVTSIIRWLLTRNIPVNFNIFLLQDNNRFSDNPDFTKEVKFKIDWSGEQDTQAMDLAGDYNGDKRKDFVFATDEDELSVYLGIEDDDRLFSKKPIAKVEANAFGELSSPDLNGDGFADMIIFYPQSKERKGMVQVLMNLSNWE